jgi:hypothetical protein
MRLYLSLPSPRFTSRTRGMTTTSISMDMDHPSPPHSFDPPLCIYLLHRRCFLFSSTRNVVFDSDPCGRGGITQTDGMDLLPSGDDFSRLCVDQ